jgi:guanylate kinase
MSMGKIYYLMGKSASGKDTVYERLLEEETLDLHRIVLYTTRPARTGEQEGVEYHFTDEAQVSRFEEDGRIIELRAYDTVYGIWKYFTADDGQIDINRCDYLGIGTLESYLKIRDYFGAQNVVPLYIEVEDGLRLERALERERKQETPKYEEMCRRFLADQKDFSEENISAAGIGQRISNNGTLEECLARIKNMIRPGD